MFTETNHKAKDSVEAAVVMNDGAHFEGNIFLFPTDRVLDFLNKNDNDFFPLQITSGHLNGNLLMIQKKAVAYIIPADEARMNKNTSDGSNHLAVGLSG